MIEIKLVISICIACLFFGMLVGCVIMGLASTESYKKGYCDGFEKGKKEGANTIEQKNVSRIHRCL